MAGAGAISPWRRLAYAAAALLAWVLFSTALYTMWDMYRHPEDIDWHSMGGTVQLVLYVLLFQGYFAIATYFMFIVPLVLFWSAEAQLRRWYVMLLLSALWLPVACEVLLRASPKHLFQQLDPFLFWMELGATFACGLYVMLLRRAIRRSA